MIKLTREDGVDLLILEKDEVDLILKGETVMFDKIILAYTNDLDYFITKLAAAKAHPEDGLSGDAIIGMIKESQARPYAKSTAYMVHKDDKSFIAPPTGGMDS